jgi:ABC-type transporter Mla MlaB component
MNWFKQPQVEQKEEGGVAVWRLLGDWTRDLPLEVRRVAVDALKAEATLMVLDLLDVNFIDSWGEEAVCDVIQRVRNEGGNVVWTRDPARSSEYEGVQRALERRRLEAESFMDAATAIAALKSAS